jgi:hypothetical protein
MLWIPSARRIERFAGCVSRLTNSGSAPPKHVLLEEFQVDAVEAILARIDYGVYG